MKRNNILKGAGVLLIAVLMMVSSVAVSADTTDKLENDGNYVSPPNVLPGTRGPTLFLQLPHDPGDSWSHATSDLGSGYTVYENFWDITEPICDIHWWGLCLIHTGTTWIAGDPDNLVFDITFYSDDPETTNLPPTDVVCTYEDIVPPVITGTGQYYSGFEMYYFDGVELDPCCDVPEGWVSIVSKSTGQGDDWLLWSSAKTGDGFSYQEAGTNPRYFDQAINLTGSGVPPLEANAHGPYEGEVGEDIQFTGSATGGVPSYTYHWEFGDGETSDDQNPTHAYDEADVYTVTLTVTDSAKDQDTDTTTATIIGPALNIGTIQGGLLKVTATIDNDGAAATGVMWNIELSGGFILLGRNTSGGPVDIAAGGNLPISSGIILGFGPVSVTVEASVTGSSDTRTQSGFVLFIYTHVSPGGGI